MKSDASLVTRGLRPGTPDRPHRRHHPDPDGEHTATPIDHEYTDVWFGYTVKTGGDPSKKGLARAIIDDLKSQFENDLPIWENKRCWDRPVLCDGDGPVATYRKWYAQFT